MSKQISLTLPDEIFRRAELIARRSGQDLTEVLTDAIEVSLDPWGVGSDGLDAIADWPDADVLAAADAMMDPLSEARLTELSDKRKADGLLPTEQAELRMLMQSYQEGMLRKASGIGEAVRRGLRQAPQP